MPSLTPEARFFGLDLRDLARQVREPWKGASNWPVFSWLTPATPVWLLQANGHDVLWADGERAGASPSAPHAKAAAFAAIEAPEELLLRRSVRLPAMGASDCESALALEARTASPFAPDDLVWGAAPRGDRDQAFSLVLASRKQLQAYQDALGGRVPTGAAPEFWVFDTTKSPVVLGGFGEPRRLAFIVRQRRIGVTLLVSAAAIAALIGLTPSLQLKLRVYQAAAAYGALSKVAAPIIAQREALVRAADKTTALQKRLADRIEPLRLLDALTRILPDDTALQSLKLSGTKVTIAGLTANASALMQLLGNQPGLRDVRAPGAATRVAGADKEAFVIEFTVDAAQFGVRVATPDMGPASNSTSPVSPVAGAVVPGQTPPPAVAVPPSAPKPAEPTAPPVQPGSPMQHLAPGKATFGGQAVFGGGKAEPPGPVKNANETRPATGRAR